LKACASRQEKLSRCYKNGAARHAHILNACEFFLRRQEKIARPAGLHALAQAYTRESLRSKNRTGHRQLSLDLDERARQASFRTIEEEAHAQGLGALNGYEAHLPANMVDIVQPIQLRIVVIGVPFQARNTLLDRLAKAGADLEAFLGGA